MEFFFSFPSDVEIPAGWRPRQSSSGLHDLFNRWLFAVEHALQEFVVVGSGLEETHGLLSPAPQLHPEANNGNLRRKMRFALPPQARCLIAKEIVSQQETINRHCVTTAGARGR